MESINTLPLVSIVIPTRNRPELACRAVRTALEQTYRNIEVLVVIDGPDAATEAALAAIPDDRLRVIPLKESGGACRARNLGAEQSRGKYIALLDDDDEWFPEKLALQVALAEEQTDETFLVASQYFISAPGGSDELWPIRAQKSGEHISEYFSAVRCGFQTSVYLTPRAHFLRYPFSPDQRVMQDWDWILRMTSDSTFRILAIDKPLSRYWLYASDAKTITRTVSWKTRFEWAGEMVRQGWMTRLAYAQFLNDCCLSVAKEQNQKWPAAQNIFFPFFAQGRPTPRLALSFLQRTLMPEWLRALLRPLRS